MTKYRLLIIDNDPPFLESMKKYFDTKEFIVTISDNYKNAEELLSNSIFDIVLIDIRLVNDKDSNDLSGIDIAKNYAHNTPKIIISNYPSFEIAREALSATKLEGLPPAVYFFDKKEKIDGLLTKIRWVLSSYSNYKKEIDTVYLFLDDDYKNAKKHITTNFIISTFIALIGCAILFVAIVLLIIGTSKIEIGIIGSISGLLTNGISFLFYKREQYFIKRSNEFHRELLEVRQLRILLSVSDEIAIEKREDLKGKIIESINSYWFTNNKGSKS